MKVLKFIKWWWLKTSTSSKGLFLLYVGIPTIIIISTVLGIDAFLLFIKTVLVATICVALYLLYRLVAFKWNEYNKELDRERDLIIAKLSGKASLERFREKLRKKS